AMTQDAVFDLTVLDVRPRTVVASLAKIGEAIAAPQASALLGCWYSEIGAINRIVLLRRPATLTALSEERSRIVLEGSPFGCAEHILDLNMDTCVSVGPANVDPCVYGATYEITTTTAPPAADGALLTLRHVTGAMPRFVQLRAWRDADALL